MTSSTQHQAYRASRPDSAPDEVIEVLGDIATLQAAHEQAVVQAATSERTMADAIFTLTRLALTHSRDVAELLDKAMGLLAVRAPVLR